VAGLAAVALRGGGCGFADKAAVAEKLGATALVVVNGEDSVFPMTGGDDASFRVPALALGAGAKRGMDALQAKPGCGEVLMRLSYDDP